MISINAGVHIYRARMDCGSCSEEIVNMVESHCKLFYIRANRLPKSFMAQNTVFLLMTAIIRNFYKAIILKMDVKKFGIKSSSRIKTFVFKFVSVPAKWIRMARQNILNIYTDNEAYARVFKTDFG